MAEKSLRRKTQISYQLSGEGGASPPQAEAEREGEDGVGMVGGMEAAGRNWASHGSCSAQSLGGDFKIRGQVPPSPNTPPSRV